MQFGNCWKPITQFAQLLTDFLKRSLDPLILIVYNVGCYLAVQLVDFSIRLTGETLWGVSDGSYWNGSWMNGSDG
jgi:hypothetical protein